jgi:hypothetical protein
MVGCRSSGVLSASKIISGNRCRLTSIHVSCIAGGPDTYTLKIYDSKDTTLTGNTEIARLVFSGTTQTQNVEFDMHNVLCSEGLYAEVTGSPIDPTSYIAYSVEFN